MQYLYEGYRRLPIIGQLYEKCSRKNMLDGLLETLAFTIFATMPLWVVPVFGHWFIQSNKSMFSQSVALAGDGELFIYSSASLGPLFYIITKKYGEWNKDQRYPPTISFPSGASFLLFSLLVCILSGLAFGILKIPELRTSASPINVPGIIESSAVLFGLALLCLFCASAYRNSIEEFMTTARMSDEDDFSKAWKAARDAN
jgi:hypothetical protein